MRVNDGLQRKTFSPRSDDESAQNYENDDDNDYSLHLDSSLEGTQSAQRELPIRGLIKGSRVGTKPGQAPGRDTCSLGYQRQKTAPFDL